MLDMFSALYKIVNRFAPYATRCVQCNNAYEIMDTLGPANYDVILLLYRGCPLSEVELYWHGSVRTCPL